MQRKWWLYPLLASLVAGGLAAALLAFAALLAIPNLPSLEALTDYRPKIPLRVYTSDGALIGEFGEERRALVKIEAVPKLMRQAILAAEDDRFYSHGGVDYLGVARAALANLSSGGAREGASTITMQVARNFFLSSEKTLTRKFSEVLLAFKIEHYLSKDQILELYINQIYLGQRAYGFAAAAQAYFGKPLEKLNVAEFAMLAGLPKAPSRYNPVANPKRAKLRQQYVLRRMHDLRYIADADFQAAQRFPLTVHHDTQAFEVKADHVAEMVRQAMFEQYRDSIYSSGLKVYTTLRRADQEAANLALRQGVLDYDRRHGYRGPEGYIDIPGTPSNLEELLEDALSESDESNDLLPAVTLEASPKELKAYVRGGETIVIPADGLKFAAKALSDKAEGKARLRRGSLIRVRKDDKGNWQIAQLPLVESALISMDPSSGAVRALVGGFDFNRSKFNHVVQAWRQPGSSFKPFIYSASLEKGFTPATVINDAPIVLDPFDTGGQVWEPKNFDGEFAGPLRMRTALTKSKNLVSIRILQAITPQYAQDYVTHFGFTAERHPPYLTMALGAGSVTPLQMATAYSVFASGGYRPKHYFIERVVDARGTLLLQAKPQIAGEEGSERVIDPRNAWIMTSMMQDVVRFGTAARAMQLKRNDLGGKTGTTNDQVDAWFAGFNAGLVAVTWIGFDQPRSLGGAETGAQAALPIWMNYMGKVLKDVPESILPMPEGITVVKVDPHSGARSGNGIPEFFYRENLPDDNDASAKIHDDAKDQLF
ncbi:MAG: penicillin-binding protein 1A [Sulfuricella sp.]|nr:penicillin-binding protein 1A [Sulfuricella sp.]